MSTRRRRRRRNTRELRQGITRGLLGGGIVPKMRTRIPWHLFTSVMLPTAQTVCSTYSLEGRNGVCAAHSSGLCPDSSQIFGLYCSGRFSGTLCAGAVPQLQLVIKVLFLKPRLLPTTVSQMLPIIRSWEVAWPGAVSATC